MAHALDLATTFIHLSHDGAAEPITVSRSFWSGSGSRQYDRVVGAFEFNSSDDLHSSMQEMHPEADEVLWLVSGAIDVIFQEGDRRRVVAMKAGEAVIVPRGVWHGLAMRESGKLLFINSRTRMQTRAA